jgi:hypothetical protein
MDVIALCAETTATTSAFPTALPKLRAMPVIANPMR